MGLQFPTVVKVLGQPFAVRVVARDEAISRHAVDSTVGQTDLNLQTIAVRGPEDLSPAQAAETLLHETLHAVMYLFNLGHFLEGDHDEEFVRSLAPALMHTLRENPALVGALMADHTHPRTGSGELVADGHAD